LNFTCQLNGSQQIVFYWTNFTSPGYNNSNLTISFPSEKNKTPTEISCNPYLSQGICSMKPNQLKPGTEYQITAQLTKVFKNYTAQKNGTCPIKTSKDKYFHQNRIPSFRSE
jgi:hypothetical protein